MMVLMMVLGACTVGESDASLFFFFFLAWIIEGCGAFACVMCLVIKSGILKREVPR